mmetsp:Transcript_13617/g.30043  ORF Transcript_13617/g.30043 Transcript_13617/m.30043 type:complete len:98 (-) Transcript_13617:416-709(-)
MPLPVDKEVDDFGWCFPRTALTLIFVNPRHPGKHRAQPEDGHGQKNEVACTHILCLAPSPLPSLGRRTCVGHVPSLSLDDPEEDLMLGIITWAASYP